MPETKSLTLILLLLLAVPAGTVACTTPGAPETDTAPDVEPDGGVDADYPPGPLRLLSSDPSDGAVKVSVWQAPSLTFSREVDVGRLDAQSIVLRTAGLRRQSIEIEADGNRLVLATARPLDYGVHYTIDVAGVRAHDGSQAPRRSIVFSTWRNPMVFTQRADANGITQWTEHQVDAAGLPTRSITYSGPGEDGAWRTADDAIARYVVYHHYSAVDIAEATYRGPGPDAVWLTPDDELQKIERRVRDESGRLLKQIAYGSVGADGTPFTADDEITYYTAYTYGDHMIESLVYSEPGADGVWNTGDDVLTSYSRHSYDELDRLTAVDYFNGAGEDNEWFTSDDRPNGSYRYGYGSDAVSSYTDPHGQLRWYERRLVDGDTTSVRLYRDPGADQMWYTADDVLDQRRDIVSVDGQPVKTLYYDAAATITRLSTTRRNAHGAPLTIDTYDGPGADGVWETADDQRAVSWSTTYDDKGNRMVTRRVSGPGADGIWFTGDDVVSSESHYDPDK